MYQDGESRVIDGVTYVRQGGQWLPQGGAPMTRQPSPQAGIPELVVPPQPPKPEKPTAIPGYPGYFMGSDGKPFKPEGLPEQPQAQNANDQKLQAKRAALTSLETQINRVDELYRNNFKDEAFGILSSLSEYAPTDDAAQFNAAGAGLAEQGLAAFRVPGVGSQSDTELRQFVEANRPGSWDRDSAVEEKLRQLRARVDATRQEMGLPPAQWLGAEKIDQSTAPAEIAQGDNGQDQLTASTNGYETVNNPKLAGVRGKYLSLLESGAAPGEIVQYLRKAGISDPKLLQAAVKQSQFRKQNPNVPIGNYNTSALDDMDVPLSSSEQSMNEAAQSALGAYGMQAGQALSLNTLDDLAPNQERAQLALEDSARNHSTAAPIGALSGGVLAAMGGEAGLARLGMGAGFGRAAIADMGYGAGAGAGASEDNRIGGAVSGGLAGLIGSAAGQGISRTAGNIIGGPGDQYARQMIDENIPLTVGGAVQRSGRLGQIVKSVEDKMSGVPILGDTINARRSEGIRAMNAKTFDKALEPINENVGNKVGEEAVAEAHGLIQNAFKRALGGKTAQVDDLFLKEARPALERIASIRRDGLGMEIVEQIEEATKGMFDETGQSISGEGMQALLGSLRQIRQAYKNDPLAHKIGEGVKGIERAVEGIFERQAPEVMPDYRAAKAAYRRLSIVSDAVNSGKNGEGLFTPAQLGQADRNNTKNLEGKIAAASGKSPFHDFQRAAQETLPNRVPDSGTAGRVIVPGALLAAGGTADTFGGTGGAGIGIASALTLLYSKRGQAFLTRRGPKAHRAGKRIKDSARYIGHAGASAGVIGSTD